MSNQQLQQELEILKEMIAKAELAKEANELLLKVYYIAKEQLETELEKEANE